MSAYNGRTGPNFSQYLNNLNTIPSGYDQDLLGVDDINIDQELAIFTNADFTDFDALGGGFSNDQSINFNMNDGLQPNAENGSDIKYEELLSGEPNHFMSSYGPSMQPMPQQHATFSQSQTPTPLSNPSPPPSATSTKTGSKRKQDAAQIAMEEQSRIAAEEDKRRRNTAASARFRVKKKQREQALEQNVKAMTDKNDKLQSRIEQLERENQWLRNLVTEKNGKQTEKDISDLYQQFRRESEEADSRGSAHKDGVGTQ